MSGERKISNKPEYGTLSARPYVIFGNDIVAFYDKSDDLIFVLDNTLNSRKPNVLLVINPDGDKKWDEILSDDYLVDLENIRPKQDNKYQKLDIEYSGLAVYENLINAYNAGEDLTDYLSQLDVLRDSAARHSAVIRLNAANEIIAKANNTIVKTKETIADLQARLKTLRAKLSGYRKEIGKISTKQSASKILRTESQIEAINDKLKRAKKRLESAQRRLDAATTDAELASGLLNTPVSEIKHVEPKSKSVMVAPKYPVQKTEPTDEVPEIDDAESDFDEPESDIKPLFDKDPEILNEDIAFKPITFDVPSVPMDNSDDDKIVETKPEDTEQPSEFKENIFESVNVPDFNALTFESTESEKPTESTELSKSFEPESDFVPPLDTAALLSQKPEIEIDTVVESEPVPEEPKSVLESMTPVPQFEPTASEDFSTEETQDIKPVTDLMRPVPPTYTNTVEQKTENIPEKPIGVQQITKTFNAPVSDVNENTKSKFIYYVLLIFLIILSVLTLWLYQKNMNTTTPVLIRKTSETVVEQKQDVASVNPAETVNDVIEETVFLDEPGDIQSDTDVISESVVVTAEPEISAEISEDVENATPEPAEEPTETETIDTVPEPAVTEDISEPEMDYSESENEDEPDFIQEAQDEIDKPEYGAGSKHEDMFVIDSESEITEPEYTDDMFYDSVEE